MSILTLKNDVEILHKTLEDSISEIEKEFSTKLAATHRKLKDTCAKIGHPNIKHHKTSRSDNGGEYVDSGYSTCPDCYGWWDHYKGEYPEGHTTTPM